MKEKYKNIIRELGVFMKRHILINAIFVICVFVIVKFSKLPVWNFLPDFLVKLFVVPEIGSVAYERYVIYNNLAFAYIASIITYILIQYIPERQRQIRAYQTLKGPLDSLYSCMSRLIAMYLYDLRISKTEAEIAIEDLKDICEIEIYDREKFCGIRDQLNGKEGNTFSHSYNLYTDSKSNVELIDKNIQKIMQTPNAAHLDTEIIDLISEIENNWFYRYLLLLTEPQQRVPKHRIHIINFNEAFFEFIRIHRSLYKFAEREIWYVFSDITDEEVKQSEARTLFCVGRSLFIRSSVDRAENVVSRIVEMGDEVPLRKAEGVLLEMLVSYDTYPDRLASILPSADRLACFIYQNEQGDREKAFALLNCLQVKKRMRPLLHDECELLEGLIRENSEDSHIILGAAILLEKYDIAQEALCQMNEDDREFFVQLPIYRLWPNPPEPANLDPIVFNVF